MSLIEEYRVLGALCSKPKCGAEIRPAGLSSNPFRAREELQALAEPVGWSAWTGRSLRLYCPLHGPTAATIARGRVTRLW